jgi:hypothetical protein
MIFLRFGSGYAEDWDEKVFGELVSPELPVCGNKKEISGSEVSTNIAGAFSKCKFL